MTIKVDMLRLEVHLLVPTTPNFLRTADDQTISVSDIPVKDLRKVAKAWTDELIKKGKK